MRTLRAVVLALATLAVLPAVGIAQRARSASLTLDNDLLAVRGRGPPPDYDYTHGVRVGAEFDAAPLWGRLVPTLSPCSPEGTATESCLRTHIEVGHRIYTPRLDAAEPIPGERPYAAWLYAGAQAQFIRASGQRSLALELGVVGPPAGGKPVQNGVHRLLGSEAQVGWPHQLATEPGVVVRYREAWMLSRPVPGAGSVRLTPSWGVALGNVLTAAQAGASVRLGMRAPPGATQLPSGEPSAYLDLGGRAEGVLRNIFLDGNTFRSNSLARKHPFVLQGEVGAGYRFRRWALDYRFVVRTPEYRDQPEAHDYGSLTLTRSW